MKTRFVLLVVALALVVELAAPFRASAATARPVETIQDAINLLIAAAEHQAIPATVDTAKSGDPKRKLTGVVTTFMANRAVIEQAIALSANLIVTHEPTFYSHRDDTDWLESDRVYQAKRALLETHGIVVFRYHDYMHTIRPDPVLQATIEQLGWGGAAVAGEPNVFRLPPRPLAELVAEVKERLAAPQMRVVGQLDASCTRVGVMVGAAGGRAQIRFLSETKVDVLIVGEIAEWETSEYIRDAMLSGHAQALIVVGHSPSEALGMKWLAGWLQERVSGVTITYVPADAPFQYF